MVVKTNKKSFRFSKRSKKIGKRHGKTFKMKKHSMKGGANQPHLHQPHQPHQPHKPHQHSEKHIEHMSNLVAKTNPYDEKTNPDHHKTYEHAVNKIKDREGNLKLTPQNINFQKIIIASHDNKTYPMDQFHKDKSEKINSNQIYIGHIISPEFVFDPKEMHSPTTSIFKNATKTTTESEKNKPFEFLKNLYLKSSSKNINTIPINIKTNHLAELIFYNEKSYGDMHYAKLHPELETEKQKLLKAFKNMTDKKGNKGKKSKEGKEGNEDKEGKEGKEGNISTFLQLDPNSKIPTSKDKTSKFIKALNNYSSAIQTKEKKLKEQTTTNVPTSGLVKTIPVLTEPVESSSTDTRLQTVIPNPNYESGFRRNSDADVYREPVQVLNLNGSYQITSSSTDSGTYQDPSFLSKKYPNIDYVEAQRPQNEIYQKQPEETLIKTKGATKVEKYQEQFKQLATKRMDIVAKYSKLIGGDRIKLIIERAKLLEPILRIIDQPYDTEGTGFLKKHIKGEMIYNRFNSNNHTLMNALKQQFPKMEYQQQFEIQNTLEYKKYEESTQLLKNVLYEIDTLKEVDEKYMDQLDALESTIRSLQEKKNNTLNV